MLIIVCGIIGISLIVVGLILRDNMWGWKENCGICMFIFGFLFAMGFFIMLLFSIVNHVDSASEKSKLEQTYESLTFQLENNLYDNDNDLGKKELYNQIQKWNEDLAAKKEKERNFWVGGLYPNIYEDLKFIEYRR